MSGRRGHTVLVKRTKTLCSYVEFSRYKATIQVIDITMLTLTLDCSLNKKKIKTIILENSKTFHEM